jgi:hypothetical protein
MSCVAVGICMIVAMIEKICTFTINAIVLLIILVSVVVTAVRNRNAMK